MAKTNKNDQLAQDDPRESAATNNQQSQTPPYTVGYCLPPLETRFQKAKSGNPAGRQKRRRNVKSELEEIVRHKVKIRDSDKEREMSLLAANFFAHAVKGAKGDSSSAGLLFNLADRVGLMNSEDGADNLLRCEHVGGVALGRNSTAPSSGLFENLDIERLSREEVADLSRIAETIDLGGDFTALSPDDFKRV